MAEKKLTAHQYALYLGCEVAILVDDNLHGKIQNDVDWISKVARGLTIEPKELAEKHTVEHLPILRSIESITDEEAVAIATMASEHDIGVRKWNIYRGNTRIRLTNNGNDEHDENNDNVVDIYYSMTISFRHENDDAEQQIGCQAEIIIYLLQKHIDIFGWIGNGYALDIEKLYHYENK